MVSVADDNQELFTKIFNKINNGEIAESDNSDEENDAIAKEFNDETNRKKDFSNLKEQIRKTDESATKYFQKLREVMIPICANGKVKKRVVKEADEGASSVPFGAKVIFDYVAYFEGASEPFDSTLTQGRPYCITLDSDSLLYGLQLSLYSMRSGEIAQFLVHYDYAYLASGYMDFVPPKTFILFEVRLISVFDVHILKSFEKMSIEDRTKFATAFQVAETLNKKANNLFKSKVTSAIQSYNEAVNALIDCRATTADEQKKRDDLLVKLYTDLAVCYNRNGQPRKANQACKSAIKFISDSERCSAKLFYHEAKSLMNLNELDQALLRIKKAAKLSPTNSSIANLQLDIEKAIERQKKNWRKMAEGLLTENSCDNNRVCGTDTKLIEDLKTNAVFVRDVENFRESFYVYLEEILRNFLEDPDLKYFPAMDNFLEREFVEFKRFFHHYGLHVFRKDILVYFSREPETFFDEF